MGKDTQDIEWYRRWVKQVKEEFKQYNSGEATLTQLDATISQVPSTIKTVSCEGLVARDVEFGFGIRYGPYGKQAWMDPHQFITLPQVFFDDLAMTSEMIESRNPSGENGAQARTIVAKLLEAVYKELRLSGFAGPNDIRVLQKKAFTFYPMKYREGWKRHKVRCVGRTAFSFHFGDEEAQAINLVIETRPKGDFNGEGQILSCMAMVLADRKRRRQSDCTVFGCLTDSEEFSFFRLTHDGTWSKVVLWAHLYSSFQDAMNVAANFFASFLHHGLDTPLRYSVPTIASHESDSDVPCGAPKLRCQVYPSSSSALQ